MKILHVITSLRTGGAEKLMVDLLPRLKASGHDVDLLLFDGADTPFRRDAEAAGIKVYDLGVGGSVYSPMRLFKLIPYLKKYDIVHTHNTAPQLFSAIGRLFAKTVLFTTEHNTSNRRRGWKWYKRVDHWMYNRYRKVICISDKTEENLRMFIGKTRAQITTIPNGIDIERYAAATEYPLKQLVSGCSKALVQIAGFRQQKDQDTVIRALPKLAGDIHLFLVGDGDRRQELEMLVSELSLHDRVHFMGVKTKVAEILKGADIAIMSSHWEGFGLAAVEAMAAGIPVLASNVDGLAQIVDGAGLLFEHQDDIQLAHQINRLLGDKALYESFVGKGRERAEQFSIEKMADRYIDQYNKL